MSTEDDFWEFIIENLELFQTTESETSSESGTKIGGKGTAEANFLIAKGSGEISTELEKKRGSTVTAGRTVSSRVAALSGLRKSGTAIVVDDFHYIPRDIQGNIVRALKPLIFDGLPVVIIAIPHRRYDALKVEKEMTGRISPIQIPSWTEEELAYIPNTGFALLNYNISETLTKLVASESIGSPHLMQDFCRGICKARNIEASQRRQDLDIPRAIIESTFKDVAETIGRPIFEKLARGPRARTDRIQRSLHDGRIVDIYQLVLHALAHLKPGLISIEYEELRSAIRAVSGTQIPQLQEVARVLKHMATIASTDQSSTPVIDFEEEEKKLHITDPFFAFYLRWGELLTDSVKD